MAQGDFGVVPNVWRPQFVPPINSGEDTQVGIPGNSAQNIASTTTTIEEFGTPFAGWQKVLDIQAQLAVNTTTYTKTRSINLDMQTPNHLIVVTWQDPAVNNGSLFVRFQDVPGPNFNAGSPFGEQSTSPAANGIGYMVWRIDTMLNAVNNSTSISIPTPVNTAHRTLFIINKYVHSITASSVANNGVANELVFILNNTSVANNMPIPHSLLISPIITLDVQAKMAAGATSTIITQIAYYKSGDRILSAQTTT